MNFTVHVHAVHLADSCHTDTCTLLSHLYMHNIIMCALCIYTPLSCVHLLYVHHYHVYVCYMHTILMCALFICTPLSCVHLLYALHSHVCTVYLHTIIMCTLVICSPFSCVHCLFPVGNVLVRASTGKKTALGIYNTSTRK